MPRHSTVRRFTSIGMGAISVVASAFLISLFGFSDDHRFSNDDVRFIAVAIAASVFAAAAVVASWQQLVRHWPLTAASLLGITALVVLAFMLWLHQGANEVLTKFSVIVLCGIVAIALARYVRVRSAAETILCPECGKLTLTQLRRCIHCDTLLRES